ncbi:SGNH/GDSL hydrolase family protein [Microbacterium barkeri]|uniref:SGNH/GDSL hydrolase family protein n=1 Tax=Microbacterium barkeri TaxID=33917 RepID=UPI0024AF9CDA|nr:SGNH/GDSL hydrolase family protein [Microbacterium barkeri]MDI6942523.1 SGNH/GDSL hydrolase family protein [Microbacterium barkeri]
MTAAHPTRRPVVLAAAIGFLLLAAALVLGVWRPWAPLPLPDAAGASDREAASAESTATIALPDDPTVLVFGDSWTYGSAATTPTGGYAYRFGELEGWETVVDGVRGSGYLKPGIDGPAFGERIAALDPALDPDLVIVQGSINDRRQDLSRYAGAVNAAWDALAELYPDAAIVILGPAPHILPVEDTTAELDRRLSALATDRGWPYISPVQDEWITAADYLRLIDTSERGARHPSDAGHAHLAERLVAAIAEITAPVQVEAAENQPEPALPAAPDVYETPSPR